MLSALLINFIPLTTFYSIGAMSNASSLRMLQKLIYSHIVILLIWSHKASLSDVSSEHSEATEDSTGCWYIINVYFDFNCTQIDILSLGYMIDYTYEVGAITQIHFFFHSNLKKRTFALGM